MALPTELMELYFLQFKVSRNTEMHYAKQFCYLGVGFLIAALYIKIFRLHISKYSPFIETHFVTFLSNRGVNSLFMETLPMELMKLYLSESLEIKK